MRESDRESKLECDERLPVEFTEGDFWVNFHRFDDRHLRCRQ
jgi:hypothetical protein